MKLLRVVSLILNVVAPLLSVVIYVIDFINKK